MAQLTVNRIIRDSFSYVPYEILAMVLLFEGSYGRDRTKSKSIEEIDLGRLEYIYIHTHQYL